MSFELFDVVLEYLLLLGYLDGLPPLILLTELHTAIPLGIDIDILIPEELHELLLLLISDVEEFLLLSLLLVHLLQLPLLLHLDPPLFDFVGQLPHGLAGHRVVVELLAVGVFVLFPLRVLKHLLGSFEALRHVVLRFFCGFVVVVGHPPHRCVD